MTLDDFLKRPGAPSTAAFAATLGLHEGQVRQWRHGYVAGGADGKPRVPSPENCVLIERATNGLVTRRDLRPHDWVRIWPPDLPAPKAAAIKRPRKGESALASQAPRPPADAPAGPVLMLGDRREPLREAIDRIVHGPTRIERVGPDHRRHER